MCVCVCATSFSSCHECLFEGIHTLKRIQMGDRDDDGAVLYGVAVGCFVRLFVCVSVYMSVCVCVFETLTTSVFLSGVDVRCSAGGWQGGRDEKVYKINTPDLIGLVTACTTAVMLECLFFAVKKKIETVCKILF